MITLYYNKCNSSNDKKRGKVQKWNISWRDCYPTSTYVINEIKIHYLAHNNNDNDNNNNNNYNTNDNNNNNNNDNDNDNDKEIKKEKKKERKKE